ncbi:MAG: DUF3850 domain-containing protein [Patescibacteria group bacterium]|nr:DUF3850 domain-containing protein [Patescibacteria group bacterium]
MTVHYLKTISYYWDAIKRGEKNFEVRLDDRGFQRGDILVLHRMRENDPSTYDMDGYGFGAKHKEIRKTITYILSGGRFGIQAGHVVMALADPTPEAAP